MNKLDKLKKEYEEIEIPSELEGTVKSAIQQAKKSKKRVRNVKQWTLGATAAAALFIGSINLSPPFAQAMANVPLIGSIVEVFTGERLTVDKDTYQADMNIPEVSGLTNKQLQNSLNEKYIEENKALFEEFERDVAEMEKEIEGGGHLGVATGYEIMTDTDQLLSIGRYQVNTVGSSSTTMKYDTVDKQNSILITLPSLFKDEKYVDVISDYILMEMKSQMAADENVIYFSEENGFIDFEGIQPNQAFYITPTNKLVISFDKYEIAPGYMGVITFEIPTNIVKDLLVSDLYIK